MDLQQGFILSRHWQDTPAGTEVDFWLATDQGLAIFACLASPLSPLFPPSRASVRGRCCVPSAGWNCVRWNFAIFVIDLCSVCIASSTAS